MKNTPLLMSPKATHFGLIIALSGGPALAAGFRLITGENHSDLQVLCRELIFFAMVGLLIWIVRRREKLPLASIGLHTDRLGKSILWGSLLAAISLVVTVALYLVLPTFGISLGGSDGNSFKPSILVLILIMLRAGVVEEICYRGYAIERLELLTGSRWLAALLPLAVFAAAHYRQGLGGIIAAFVLGSILTYFYMKRRDLVANMTGHFLADFVINIVLPIPVPWGLVIVLGF
jgi:uncharacterized protein